jgi:ubiquinol-cytochrome c reductase cytochrome b subunit
MSKGLKTALTQLMIKDVPAYANKFFYSLGFLSMISFVILIITGVIMSFYGPNWWITSSFGSYMRSVHLWATQAFIIFIILHLLIVFLTSGYKKPRRLTWVIGVGMLLLVILQSEFGYLVRNDFSSQWRALQGADFYNGSGLGYWINALNSKQVYGLHLVVIPFLLVGLLFLHYLLIRFYGIAKPYKKDIDVKTVPANHNLLFIRGGLLIVLILILAYTLPSPLVEGTTIKSIAKDDPVLTAQTLVKEYNSSSDTATYSDNIAPYTFNTKDVYVIQPYQLLISSQAGLKNNLIVV